MRITFTIPGVIRGKGRLRTRLVKTKTGKQFVHGYTPTETQHAEAMVRQFGYQAMNGLPPMEGPLSLKVTIFKQPTASWSKKKQASSFFVTGKPDLDNVIKLLGDALNKVVWNDDAQIAQIHVARYYSRGPEQTEVEISDDLLYPIRVPVIEEIPFPADDTPLFKRIRRKRVAA